jgi:predicted Zn-dependent protease
MKKKDKKDAIEYQKALKDAAYQIASGKFSAKEYYGLTDGGLECIYSVGHEMFAHKQYENAKSIFSLLATIEPKSIKYVSAAGSACFMSGDYMAAWEFFQYAMVLGDYNPRALLRAAECSIRLGQNEATKKYLNELLSVAGDKKFKDDKNVGICVARANLMLSAIKKQEEDAAKAAESGKNAGDADASAKKSEAAKIETAKRNGGDGTKSAEKKTVADVAPAAVGSE